MTPLIHFEQEVLYGTLFQPLCQQNRDAFEDIDDDCEMTPDPECVTCRACLAELGYGLEPKEIGGLTECVGDPLLKRRAA